MRHVVAYKSEEQRDPRDGEHPMPNTTAAISFEMTPQLLGNICEIYRLAGMISSGIEGLSEQTKVGFISERRARRIRYLVQCAEPELEAAEIEEVQEGQGGSERRERIAKRLRAAEKVYELNRAARFAGESDARLCVSYLETSASLDLDDSALSQSWLLWSQANAPERLRIQIPQGLRLRYRWLQFSPEINAHPILRAGFLALMLHTLLDERGVQGGVAGVALHELGLRQLDPHCSILMTDELGMDPFCGHFINNEMFDMLIRHKNMQEYYEEFLSRLLAVYQSTWGEFTLSIGTWSISGDLLDDKILNVLDPHISMSISEMSGRVESPPPRRTLQRRLKALVDRQLIHKEGSRKGTRYRLKP